MNWWNEYVGIPYKAKGRDKTGLDCWGLVRLVYKEQYDTLLPSFAEVYEQKEHNKQAELIAMHKEGWEKTSHPATGDVVLFRINGSESHVGVVTNPSYFLHVREGQDAVIEKLDSVIWKHRIVGFYKYREGNKPLIITAKPDPLKTIRIDTQLPTGVTVRQMADLIRHNNGVAEILDDNAIILVDGVSIPKHEWEITVPKAGAVVEYRAVATGGGGGLGRTLGVLAVFVAVVAFQQYYLAPALVSAGFGATVAGVTTLTATGIGISVASGVALSYAGSLLINAIFPIRPPSFGQPSNDVGSPLRMNMLNGAQNQLKPYASIPVVLGKIRWSPPVGATTYTESQGTDSYLRMLLVWGYGPIQVSDLRIGENAISTFNEVEVATLQGLTSEDKTDFNRIYGKDVDQQSFNVQLRGPDEDETDRWVSATLQESDNIQVNLSFPNGLRRIQTNYGVTNEATFRATIQVRQLDANTLAPLTSWGSIQQTIPAYVFQLKPAWFNVDNDEELEQVYQLTRVSVDQYGKIIVRRGAMSKVNGSNPTGTMLTRLQQDNFGINATYNWAPAYGSAEESLWDIVMYGNTIVSTTDRRGATGGLSVTGCDISNVDYTVTIASGTISRSETETIRIGGVGEPYARRKNAFAYKVSFNVTRGVYEVRIRCTSSTSQDNNVYQSGGAGIRYATCILNTITGFKNARPVTPPKPLAMSAIRIKATDQLNNNLEGISGSCISICKDWDRVSETWVDRPTRNPASLFRYVLQHPANIKRVEDSAIDLDELVVWHNYCRVNSFMFDTVLTGQQSIYDVLRDIAAAGRSSPIIKNNKWTVITDKTRSTYAQYFTPHNSWGFEGIRTLPQLPHAFRVQFVNSEKGYEPDEMIVYNDGYTSANATLIEGLELRGVTTKNAIFKHARFHLAQLKLRPETYTINADIEHIVCNRGDLVKVTHDIPMWGLGSGRISERLTSTKLKLSEAMPMDNGVQYTIRIRLQDGTSITRTVVAKGADGYYDEIDLTSSVTTTQAAQENLFLFGALSEESVDLIVQSIEPMDNMSARITLVDYSPAIYDSDDEVIPAFDSQITKPPILLEEKITQKPTITGAISNETQMIRLAPNVYQYGVRVAFRNPSNLQSKIAYVEGQLDFVDSNGDVWQNSTTVPITERGIFFTDVEEQAEYKFRMRYLDEQGRVGPWSSSLTTTIQGRINPPSNVAGLSVSVSGLSLFLDWDNNPEPDVELYEVRLNNADFGTNDSNRVFYGAASSCYFNLTSLQTYTFYVKARDSVGNYSTTATSVAYNYQAPNNPASGVAKINNDVLTLNWSDATVNSLPVAGYEVRQDTNFGSSGFVFKGTATTCVIFKELISTGTNNFYIKSFDINNSYSTNYTTLTHTYSAIPNISSASYTFADTALTSATITIDWTDVSSQYSVDYYEITYGAVVKTVKASTITLEANWIGSRNYLIKTVDINGNKSSGYTLNAVLLAPSSANNYRASVIDNNVMLYWTLPAKTSLPISHALIKKGATWATATLVGEKSGEFTTINEPQGGTFTYWIAMVDTDGNESTPISRTAKVSEPPDFIFYGSQDSTFTGTLTSAYLENNTVIIPVNTTETWEDHFTARSPAWATIQDQIDAGYPVYIQPSDLDGNYQEVFDFLTILASSRITVSVGGEVIAGSPAVSVNIDTSDDNITWSLNEGTTDIFATQFRYVRVTVRVTGTGTAIYQLESLNVRADAKQITDSGQVSALSTDASGTIVNFNKTFIDVESITATAASTSANIVVYDFNDNLLSGTYSVTSNVITVNVTSHGFIAGQKVRLGFITGTATTGVVTIATASTNSFTASLTTADTSGNVSVYPESFRVYVFNTSGTRVSSTVSWNARGY
jgi:predicted phage tail protein